VALHRRLAVKEPAGRGACGGRGRVDRSLDSGRRRAGWGGWRGAARLGFAIFVRAA